MEKSKLGLWMMCLVVVCEIFEFSSGKTAPEFTVTIDTENFKEIRIPMDLWKKIITRNYNPSGKIPSNKTSSLHKLKVNEIVDESESSLEADDSEEAPSTLPNLANNEEVSAYDNAYVIEGIPENVVGQPASHEVILHIQVPDESNPDAVMNSGVGSILSTNMGDTDKPVLEVVPIINPMLEPEIQAAIAEGDVEAVANPLGDSVQAVQDVATPPSSVLVQTARFPCTCSKGSCGCCAIMFLEKGCALVTFLPEEFSFEMKMTMNGNVIAKRKIPVSDPPPFCFNPRRAPFLELCAQLNNIHFRKDNVHVCVDVDASVGGFDLFSWTFNCLKFGNQGIVTGLDPETATPAGRPESSGLLGDLFGDDEDDDDSDEGGLLDDIFDDDDY